jgi:YD repeat-containing protein
MSKCSAWAILALLALSACDHDVPEARYSPRHARRVALDECIAMIPVFPAGQVPSQPYRVLAPIDSGFVGNWGWSSTSRFIRMKRRACELGADAILDADEPVADARVTTLQYDAYGRPVTIVQEDPRGARRSTALAVQFAPPQVAVAQAAEPPSIIPPQTASPPLALPQPAPPPIVITQPAPAQVIITTPAAPAVVVTTPPPVELRQGR